MITRELLPSIMSYGKEMEIFIFINASLSNEKHKKLLGALVTSICQTLLGLHTENDFQKSY